MLLVPGEEFVRAGQDVAVAVPAAFAGDVVIVLAGTEVSLGVDGGELVEVEEGFRTGHTTRYRNSRDSEARCDSNSKILSPNPCASVRFTS